MGGDWERLIATAAAITAIAGFIIFLLWGEGWQGILTPSVKKKLRTIARTIIAIILIGMTAFAFRFLVEKILEEVGHRNYEAIRRKAAESLSREVYYTVTPTSTTNTNLLKFLSLHIDTPTSITGTEMQAEVIYLGEDGVNLRSNPSHTAPIMERLYYGATMSVVADRPVEGWWPVCDDNCEIGWIAEIDYNVGARLVKVGPRSFRSHVRQGKRVKVVYVGLDLRGAVNIRRSPGWLDKEDRQDVIEKVYNGTELTVEDGPEMKDGLIWWKVCCTSEGDTGWIAEVSSVGTRLICPLE